MGAINPSAAIRTDAEWASVIDQAHANLPTSFPTYAYPEPGTAEFAQYIDHTLLKEDATTAQIEQLCEEAKNYMFKVCNRSAHFPPLPPLRTTFELRMPDLRKRKSDILTSITDSFLSVRLRPPSASPHCRRRPPLYWDPSRVRDWIPRRNPGDCFQSAVSQVILRTFSKSLLPVLPTHWSPHSLPQN